MKRNVKSLLALGLILSTCAMAAPAVSAAEAPQPQGNVAAPRYDGACSASCAVRDNGKGTASMSATANGNTTVTKIVLNVELQKKGAFGSYSTVESFSKTVNGKKATYSGTAAIDSSKIYRLKVTCTFYTSSGSETHTEYSDPTK